MGISQHRLGRNLLGIKSSLHFNGNLSKDYVANYFGTTLYESSSFMGWFWRGVYVFDFTGTCRSAALESVKKATRDAFQREVDSLKDSFSEYQNLLKEKSSGQLVADLELRKIEWELTSWTNHVGWLLAGDIVLFNRVITVISLDGDVEDGRISELFQLISDIDRVFRRISFERKLGSCMPVKVFGKMLREEEMRDEDRDLIEDFYRRLKFPDRSFSFEEMEQALSSSVEYIEKGVKGSKEELLSRLASILAVKVPQVFRKVDSDYHSWVKRLKKGSRVKMKNGSFVVLEDPIVSQKKGKSDYRVFRIKNVADRVFIAGRFNRLQLSIRLERERDAKIKSTFVPVLTAIDRSLEGRWAIYPRLNGPHPGEYDWKGEKEMIELWQSGQGDGCDKSRCEKGMSEQDCRLSKLAGFIKQVGASGASFANLTSKSFRFHDCELYWIEPPTRKQSFSMERASEVEDASFSYIDSLDFATDLFFRKRKPSKKKGDVAAEEVFKKKGDDESEGVLLWKERELFRRFIDSSGIRQSDVMRLFINTVSAELDKKRAASQNQNFLSRALTYAANAPDFSDEIADEITKCDFEASQEAETLRKFVQGISSDDVERIKQGGVTTPLEARLYYILNYEYSPRRDSASGRVIGGAVEAVGKFVGRGLGYFRS